MMLAMHPFDPPTLLDIYSTLDAFHTPRRFARAREAPRLVEQKDGTQYALTLSAPGVSPSDLTVSVADNTLTIRGETVSGARSHSVHWTTTLPRDADPDKASTSVANGIVSVTVPKKPPATPLRIAVTTSAPEIESSSDDEPDAISTYTLTLPAPGLSASDVEVVANADEGVLTVKGETKRTGASVGKIVRLPRDAEITAATAAHIDGLLTITVPKKMPGETKRLIVNTERPEANEVDEEAEDFEMA